MYSCAKKLFMFILCTNSSSFFPMNPDAQEYIPGKKFIIPTEKEELLIINDTEQLEQKFCSQKESLKQQNHEFQKFLNEAVKALMHSTKTNAR